MTLNNVKNISNQQLVEDTYLRDSETSEKLYEFLPFGVELTGQ
jgi:hypothetical protein